jgi:uncharacterized membrane protein YraQ (UPF0718 family)
MPPPDANEGSGLGIDWFKITVQYLVPGMLILAILGVIIYQYGSTDTGGNSIFYDVGSIMFNFGG